MRRRDFLKAAGASAGYSLLVCADPTPFAAGEVSPEDRRRYYERIAPPLDRRRTLAAEPHVTLVELSCDVLVAGGGLAGVLAAVAAARHGAQVILVQDRSRLGGNSSSEVKMHVVGANCHKGRPGWREGGLLEEFRLDDAVNNPQRSFALWDLLLYDKVVSEPNITLLLDTAVFAAAVREDRIAQVMARCDKTEHLYRITPKLCCDCTARQRPLGDGLDRHDSRQARQPTHQRRLHPDAERPGRPEEGLRGRGGHRRLADGRSSAGRLRSRRPTAGSANTYKRGIPDSSTCFIQQEHRQSARGRTQHQRHACSVHLYHETAEKQGIFV